VPKYSLLKNRHQRSSRGGFLADIRQLLGSSHNSITRENRCSLDTIFATPVALAQHPNPDIRAIQRPVEWREGVRAKMSASARLLGFDIGDWSILAAGLALVGLLTMLF
jgi:hypothetical protein